jgi:hypothetical protein|tara:strand:+ start:21596 stop:22024 length:429 start_codon:yes stop_codon:yes gene_type:complete
MGIKEVIQKVTGAFKQEDSEALPDDQTRDKHLRSLRREMRVMDEEEEKKALIKEVALRKKLRMRKQLFGIREENEREKEEQFVKAMENKNKKIGVLESKLNHANMMREQSMLKEKNMFAHSGFGEKKPKKHKDTGFLGQGFL